MALEESSDAEKDVTEEYGGITFVVEKGDAEAVGGLTIDYLTNSTGEGFVIQPEGASSSCGSCSGSCGS